MIIVLAIRGLKVHVHASEERLIQAARGNKVDGFIRCKCSEEIKEREKVSRLGEESSAWSVFEAD